MKTPLGRRHHLPLGGWHPFRAQPSWALAGPGHGVVATAAARRYQCTDGGVAGDAV